jgi:Uma2 family endonuclease
MSDLARLHRYSYTDYLALEQASNVKHEFLGSEIYAMAGGTPEHAALVAAVSGALLAQLRGGACHVYSSDLRVRVLATGLATYPDVTVVCGVIERDTESPSTVVNPMVVVEVLSDSTEEYDRGEKLENYRQIESLQAVILVSHRVRMLELFEKGAEGWSRRNARSTGLLDIVAIECTLDVDRIYDDAGVLSKAHSTNSP